MREKTCVCMGVCVPAHGSVSGTARETQEGREKRD